MKVQEIKPTTEELRVILETGFVLRESARFDDAEAVFQGCIEFLPDSDVPRVGLGTVYLQKGDFDSAKDACEEALNINPDSDYARVHYAEALLFQNKPDEAKPYLNKVIENSPNSTYARTAQNILNAADSITSNS